MSYSSQPRAKTHRPALVDATERLNNIRHSAPPTSAKEKFLTPHHESLKPNGQLPISESAQILTEPHKQRNGSSMHALHPLASSPANPRQRLSAISRESQAANPKRFSEISTTSTTGSDGKPKRKTHIGPWQLGKTLGKGSTARVRMARHATTGQTAAVKIVPKEKSRLAQIGSLIELDRKDVALIDSSDGFRRMPYGIEREVAIMKLISHPHIMKLYDIWENRTEIYLIMEYCERGEFFDHIYRNGQLEEEEAMFFFRQLLSAVGYCHSFNICHRDLKPENMLLNKEGYVKVADFGMAALHQTPDHKLRTSCGSPHYAAPEVIRGNSYRGDKVDIWSMAVILFASLAGRIPFDTSNGDVCGVLAAIKECDYEMDECFSDEATDLIYRMLQLNPKDRLSISQIWKHPLLQKYNYLDDYGGAINPRSPDIQHCIRPVLRRSEIDRELLRHLQSLWHAFEEQKIIKLLLNDEPNDQKLFYGLLLKYRDAQLENYVPEVAYSSSDYHHVRPLGALPKLSSRQFSRPNPNGHGRQVSRFTVVSNTTKAETVNSYDPFKSSRPQNLSTADGPVYANVVVHRGRPTLQDIKASPQPSHRSSANSAMIRDGQQIVAPRRPFASRSSLASSTRSRASGRGIRVGLTNKRGVSFSHLRKVSGASQKNSTGMDQNKLMGNRHSRFSEVTDDGGNALRAVVNPPDSARYIRSKKSKVLASQDPAASQKTERGSKLWQDDVRQLSSSLAQDCDTAFNRTSMISTVGTRLSSFYDGNDAVYETPLSSILQSESRRDSGNSSVSAQHAFSLQAKDRKSWDARPLPAPPTRSDSVNLELAEARKQAQFRRRSANGDESPGYLDRMVSHIDRLMMPSLSPLRQRGDRRTASAPVNLRAGQETNRPLPAIVESPLKDLSIANPEDFEDFMDRERIKHGGRARIISAPEPRITRPQYFDGRTSRRDYYQRESIRVVLPSSPSPVKAPAPLNIRKQASQGPPTMSGALPLELKQSRLYAPLDLQQQYANASTENGPSHIMGRDDGYEDPFNENPTSYGTVRRKKSTWFKRNPKNRAEGSPYIGSHGDDSQGNSNWTNPGDPPKKKSFGFGRLFGKPKHDGTLSVPSRTEGDDNQSVGSSIPEERPLPYGTNTTSFENPHTRQIEPRQTWIARLFHVKPATRYICFSVSNRRARQEIANLLRDWRKYGARDIVVDKDRNMVFGRVGAKNYLNLKKVSFACEIMTVVEHGKRGYLSIARFTQERGAASSFYKVVQTLETVLNSRAMLVSDKRKKKMMIKTLNA